MRTGNVDIYYAFIELGLNLLNKNGKLGFITPNSHFNTASGKNLRKLLKKNQNIEKIINFDYIKIFKHENVYNCISILTKKKNQYINDSYLSNSIIFYTILEINTIFFLIISLS